MAWHEGALLGFDLETTGTDTGSDLPVQVALVLWGADGSVEREVFLVDPGREIPSEAQAVHGISTERAQAEGRSLAEAAEALSAALHRAESGEVPIVAMNASFDATIATLLLERHGHAAPSWAALVDPLVIDRKVDRYRKGNRRLDALCVHYGIELVNAHDAAGDADATTALARAIARRYPEIAAMAVAELTACQAEWHRDWATGYDAWRRDQGRGGLTPDEFDWPVRRRPVAA